MLLSKKSRPSTKQATAYLGKIRSINWGGCLIAAYSFYLNERKAGRHKNLQIVALDYSDNEDIRTNRAFIKGKSKKAASNAHFGWTYDSGKNVFDVNGLVERYSTKVVIPQNLTRRFALNALNKGSWNSSFDRSKYVPKIEKFFGFRLYGVKVPKSSWLGWLW